MTIPSAARFSKWSLSCWVVVVWLYVMELKLFDVLWEMYNSISSLWISVCLSVSTLQDGILVSHSFFIVDGESASRMIKSTQNINQQTPIIAVTAYERSAQYAGSFDDILLKPLNRSMVLQQLRQFYPSTRRRKPSSVFSSSSLAAIKSKSLKA